MSGAPFLPAIDQIDVAVYRSIGRAFKAGPSDDYLGCGQPLVCSIMATFRPDSIRSEKIAQLFAVWLQKAGGRHAPTRGDFDLPFDIRPIIGSVAITEMVNARILHRVYGSRLVELFGMDWTGKPISDYREHGADWAVDMVETVYATGRPAHGFHTIDWQGRDHVRFEWICLPLADAIGRINMTLGAIDVVD